MLILQRIHKGPTSIEAMTQRIYFDTSVFGGYFDSMFAEFTLPLFERVKKGELQSRLFDKLEFQTYCQYDKNTKLQCSKFENGLYDP